MNIKTCAEEATAEMQKQRFHRPMVIASIVLLYLSLAVAVFEIRPVQAICVTITLAGLVPYVLRLHRLKIEAQILQRLALRSEAEATSMLHK